MNGAPKGHVYLVCFDAPLGDLANPKGRAGHYLGWADNVDARMAEHRAAGVPAFSPPASSAALLRGGPRRNDVDRSFERRLKRQHNAWKHCPRCRPPATPSSRARAPATTAVPSLSGPVGRDRARLDLPGHRRRWPARCIRPAGPGGGQRRHPRRPGLPGVGARSRRPCRVGPPTPAAWP